MVDYSRFDDLAAELSDEEAAPGRPTVTKLDGASRVTIGPTGASIAAQPAPTAPPAQPLRSGTLDYGKWDRFAAAQSSDEEAYDYEEEEEHQQAEAPVAPPLRRAAVARVEGVEEAAWCSDVAVAGSAPPAGVPPARGAPAARRSLRSEFSLNGGCVGERYLWSQSACDVTLSVVAPPGAKAKDVSVCLRRRHGEATHGLTVRLGQRVLVEGALAHAVQCGGADPLDAQAADGQPEELDWELVDYTPAAEGEPPRRCVRVTLRKAQSLGATLVFWWPRALAGDPAIDTQLILDRQRAAGRTLAARALWEQAEEQFKARVRAQERVEVDV